MSRNGATGRAGKFAKLRAVVLLSLPMCFVGGCGLWMDAGDRLARAQEARAQGDTRAAAIQLKDLLQKHPEMAEARLELGEVALQTGDLPGAVHELELARNGGLQSARAVQSLARAYIASQRAEDALALLDANPQLEDSATLSLKGTALLELGRTDGAHDAFSRAATADPKSVDAILGLASVVARTDGVAAALTLTDRAVAAAPDDARVHLARGTLHMQSKELQLAEGDFQLAVKSATAAGQAGAVHRLASLAGLAETQFASRKLDAALATTTQMQQLAPNNVVTRYLRARALFESGQLDDARSLLEQNLSANEAHVPSKFLLGALMLARGDLGQAEMYLAAVVAADPSNTSARQLLAEARLRKQKPQDALDALAPVLDGPEASAQLLALAGRASIAAGATATGLQYLERGAKAPSADAVASLDLVAGYISSGQMDRARAVLEGMPDDDAHSPRRAYMTVLTYLGQGKEQEAVQYALDSANASPKEVAPQMLAGALLAQVGRLPQAQSYFQRAAQLNPDSPSIDLNLGRLAMMQSDAVNAREYFERALRKEPAHPATSLALALLDLRQNRSAQALTTLAQARKQHPMFLEGRALEVEILTSRGDFNQALDMARSIVRDAPDRASSHIAYARTLATAGKLQEGIDSLQAAARRLPKAASVRYELARLLAAANQPDAAKQQARAVLELDANHLAAKELLSRLALARGDAAEAARIASELMAMAPNHANSHLLAGDLAVARKDYTGAASAYRKAAALSPDSAASWKEFLARYHGKLDDPLAPLQRQVAARPRDAGARMALAQGQEQLGMKEAAISSYEQVLQSAPEHPAALNNLAWLRHQQGDARALELAQRAHAAAPQRAEITDTYAWILVERGQLKQGLELLAGIAHAQASPEIRLHYAIALARSGKVAQARAIAESLSTVSADAVAGRARELLANLDKG